jgi:urease accessory protein
VGWRASLQLGFAAEGGATRLARRAHEGPLVVQRPFLPEGPDVCHVYLLHPPGGLVGGDELRVDLGVDAGAHALVTTPAATKIYRTAAAPVHQIQHLRVAAGGVLEWLPQEAIVYDGARATLETRVDLAADARFIGIDAVCFGLPARNAPFARGRCRQRFELRRDGRPLLLEHGCFDAGGAPATSRWGLGGACVLALAVAAPSPAPEVAASVVARATTAPGGDLAGVTVLGDGEVLVARYLGHDAERARAFLHDVWGLLRPGLLGRAAHPPRVWAT